MHQYFGQNTKSQDIFVLYGLGGSGKTQIALKFIQEAASQYVCSLPMDLKLT
jgi:tRNA A37 threonylcarbamoyladenosine biosynthesis protein TsaE